MPNNAKKSVYKEKEFNIYMLWKSLPAHLKGMSKNDLKLAGFADPLISKIIKIKNQTEFAKYFHIKDLGTLTDWNNKIKKKDATSPFLMTDIQKQFSNIDQQITLPNISKLKNKISKQNKTILLLKRDTATLKKELQQAQQKKIIKKTSVAPQIQNPAFIQPVITTQKVPIKQSIFKKIKSYFSL